MYRNVAQKWVVFAFDETDGTPVTGATITGKISRDGGSTAVAIADTNPTEIESGYYAFDLTAAETNYDQMTIIAVASSPANTQVVGAPATVHPIAHVISGSVTDTGPTTTNFETGLVGTAGTLLAQGYTSNDMLIGRVIIFDGNTTAALKGQATEITDYITTAGEIVVGASTLTVAPATGDTFKIY